MVFSSLPFLFIFLPFTVFLYHFMQHYSYGKYCTAILFCASLFYYAYWNPIYTVIILCSMLVNYGIGKMIHLSTKNKKFIFCAGIAANIALLVYYKYTDFFIATINNLVGSSIPLTQIVLPIGISFYTFQQIAYLSDIYMGRHNPTGEGLINYGLFVTFFPQLVAGPIVHHKEMMPQFADGSNRSINWENMYKGLCFLSMGLAKKVLIADTLSPIVKYCFDDASSLTFLEACFGSVSYALQLYFDFSGYTDMAIGCALFFNVHLPQNFNSPYKAVSIQEFWRRWHITLSRWLRDYLYIPLGGNKGRTSRILGNLFLTFLIGGIWHGAGWTFVLWGTIHGVTLVVHRVWSRLWNRSMPAVLGWALTFSFVVLAWIPFRTTDFTRLGKFGDALLGYNGFILRQSFREIVLKSVGFDFNKGFSVLSLSVLFLIIFVLFSNNSYKFIGNYSERKIDILIYVIMFIMSVSMICIPEKQYEFLYFQF